MQAHDAAFGRRDRRRAGCAGDGILGVDPESGENVLLKSGRFGPYVQLGDGDEPKRSSLPKGWTPDGLTLEKALQLLALPREVGDHPETGKSISAGLGRYGPFILHDGNYANLPDVEEVFTVGLNRAVDLLAAEGGRWRTLRQGRARGTRRDQDLRARRRPDLRPRRPLRSLRQPGQGQRDPAQDDCSRQTSRSSRRSS